jgi:hypothetical protein
MTYDVAISYAKEEAARLDQIREELRGAHLSVWSDRGLLKVADGTGEERLVPAGVDHWGAIREAIDHAAVFVYLDSPRWRASSYCRKEHQHARERGIRIVGVGPGSALAGDAERVPDGDPAALRDAVCDGLDVARAHARVRASAFDPAIADGEGVDRDDIVTLTEANLNATGMSISSPMTDCLEAASARHRRVRRRRGVFAGAAIFAAAVIAVVALVAWVGARNDNGQASAAARHVESLDLAAASEATENTFARLARARRAIGLEQNAATVAALRAAVEHFGEGISMHLKAEDPTVLAVADDGDVATVQSSGAVTLIAAGDERDQREVPAEAAPVIAFSPSGSTVAAIRRDGSGAEVIDFRTGRLRRVGATAGTTGVVFVSDRRAIAVGQSGAVLEFDPTELHPPGAPGGWRAGAGAGRDPRERRAGGQFRARNAGRRCDRSERDRRGGAFVAGVAAARAGSVPARLGNHPYMW